MPVYAATTASGRPRSPTQQVHPMNCPAVVLAAIAINIAGPTMSNAQAARPGMPTATSPAELSNRDNGVCGLETLRGTYVFGAAGFNIVAGVALPKAIAEVIEFNGDGTLSVPAATLSVNGVIIRSLPGVGTYAVADDCSGTIAFAGPAFDIFIGRHAETVWMIQTNSNTVLQGTATRTSRGRDRR
jgi:hypothetical protein